MDPNKNQDLDNERPPLKRSRTFHANHDLKFLNNEHDRNPSQQTLYRNQAEKNELERSLVPLSCLPKRHGRNASWMERFEDRGNSKRNNTSDNSSSENEANPFSIHFHPKRRHPSSRASNQTALASQSITTTTMTTTTLAASSNQKPFSRKKKRPSDGSHHQSHDFSSGVLCSPPSSSSSSPSSPASSSLNDEDDNTVGQELVASLPLPIPFSEAMKERMPYEEFESSCEEASRSPWRHNHPLSVLQKHYQEGQGQQLLAHAIEGPDAVVMPRHPIGACSGTTTTTTTNNNNNNESNHDTNENNGTHQEGEPNTTRNNNNNSDDEQHTSTFPSKRTDCFACMYGASLYDTEIGQAVRKIDQMFIENRTTSNTDALCRSIHLFFMNNIYKPAKKININVPKWTTKQIKDHLLKHMRDQIIFFNDSIDNLNALQEDLRDRIFTQDAISGRTGLSSDMFKAYLEVNKRLAHLYEQRQRRINSNGGVNNPVAAGGGIISISSVRFNR